MADSRLISGLSMSADMALNLLSLRSAARSLPSANERMPSASQYEASTGRPSRMCSAAAPSMTAPDRVSNCQVPAPGVITKHEPPSRAMPAWNEDSVRSDGFMNSSPRILPRSACGSGTRSSRCASATSSCTWSREKSARSRKRCMSAADVEQRPAQQLDVPVAQYIGRQQAQDGGIGAGAGENATLEQCRMNLLGRAHGAQPDQKSRALVGDDRPDHAAIADQG